MNGLNYERMWIRLRHKVESEQHVGIDGDGKAVFQPCFDLIGSMEKDSLFPPKTVAGETIDGEPPPRPTFVMYPDFRVMWFELAHRAEADPTTYQNLRKWMMDIEEEEIAAVDPLSHLADTFIQLYESTKAEKGGKKKAAGVSAFPDAARYRLARICSELVELAEGLG